MIAVERPVEALPPPKLLPAHEPAGVILGKRIRLSRRASAIAMGMALLVGGGGGGTVLGTAPTFGLQARAAALHQRWDVMRSNGIPDYDLAALEQEWSYTQS